MAQSRSGLKLSRTVSGAVPGIGAAKKKIRFWLPAGRYSAGGTNLYDSAQPAMTSAIQPILAGRVVGSGRATHEQKRA